MKVLVTGGAGYIGSHTLVELLSRGHAALVLDNFQNGSPVALSRVRELAPGPLDVLEADVRDADRLGPALAEWGPEAVIHFAGLKAVGESETDPLGYYDANVGGLLSLLRAMAGAQCRRIIFSSSATVYGEPVYLPYDEGHPLAPTSVYGRTKLICEQILGDWARATPGAAAIVLRYFNPVGAHPSGRIGEDPTGVPANLMPFLAQVASGRQAALRIWGEDYDTADGTGVRDYIHVMDLARAHVAALERLAGTSGAETYNVGTGRGYSVREMHAAFERAVGRALPVETHPRRSGDIAKMEADCRRAADHLGWRAEHGLDAMVESLWAWTRANPGGYGDNRR